MVFSVVVALDSAVEAGYWIQGADAASAWARRIPAQSAIFHYVAKPPAKRPTGDLISPLVALVALVAVVVGALTRGGNAQSQSPASSVDAATEPKPVPALLRRVDDFQRANPVFGFLVGVARKFSDDRAGNLAALVSYFGFFSLFPLLVALTSVLGFVLQDNEKLRDEIAFGAADKIPFIGATISENVGELKGSTIVIVVGLLGAIWAGLRVIDAIQNALNEVWDVPMAGRPKLVARRTSGLLALGLFAVGIAGSFAATALAGFLPDLPGGGKVVIGLLTFLYNIAVFLLVFQVLSELDHRWGELLPGALVASAGWTLMQTFGVVYMTRVLADAKATYQGFGTVIALLSFLFLSSQIVILAAEVNVVRARRLWPRSLTPAAGLTDADRRAYRYYADAQRRVKDQRIQVDFPGL